MEHITLHPDRFYVGDIQTFLKLVKLLKCDPECLLAFDFGTRCLEFESMMMAGVVAVGVRLKQCPGGIIVRSPVQRVDRVVMRIDTAALYSAAMGVSAIPYAFMSIAVAADGASIQMTTFDKTNRVMGDVRVCTLDKHDSDDGDFPIVNAQTGGQPLVYDVSATHDGPTWRRYLHTPTVDTVIHYDGPMKRLVWGTNSGQTRLSLYMSGTSVTSTYTGDIRICVLPSVTALLRTALQTTGKSPVTLSMSDDLPIRLVSPLDSAGSLLRMYAGTKEDPSA